MAIAQHNDNANLLSQIKGTIDKGRATGLLTDAMVNAATTKAALKAQIDAGACHNDQQNFKEVLGRMVDVAGWSDSDISGVTTVAGLQALVPGTLAQQSVLD